MHCEDLYNAGPLAGVGCQDRDFLVQAARTEQGCIKQIWAIGRRAPDDFSAQARITHHFHQALEDAVTNAIVAALSTRDGLIDLVDEDNGRRHADDRRQGSLESPLSIAYPLAEDLAGLQFNERHTSLFCQCSRKTRFPGSCRSYQQQPLWNDTCLPVV